ncbi:hypothetical protein TNCT_30531 [Trichonephila clavata]|uniref:Uncharacterized protein n=1 Tax=Trichonephila clavata TaxID=2740835 RepID=A0A8X6KWN7_TRICU|nr:hypothetical protein TNCT_30531 [Trichonephila clavata]
MQLNFKSLTTLFFSAGRLSLSGRRSSIPAVAKRFRRNVHSFRSATRLFKGINLRMLREHRIKTKKAAATLGNQSLITKWASRLSDLVDS